MDSALDLVNNQFVKVVCIEDNRVYNAYIRVGSISGIIDHKTKCTVITPEKTYQTNLSFSQLESKLRLSVIR